MADDFGERMRSGDRREQLHAMRDFLINELTGSRCPDCGLRASETAALMLRLTKILAEIDELPPEEVPDGVVTLDSIKKARGFGGPKVVAKDTPSTHGTKLAPRRQGGRAQSR